MVTVNEARGAIYTAFSTDWGTTSVLDLDNEDFDPPTGVPWARLIVRHSARAQESLGGVGRRKFESIGSAIVQCFTPLDKGAAPADALAQVAMGILEGKTLLPEGIRFTAAVPTEIGPTEDYYQFNVEASFAYVETK